MRRKTERQIEKNHRVQQQILAAARQTVGRVGYGLASIARIAEAAGISTGMFYLQFKSKEDLYDQLLPWCNIELSDYVAQRVAGATCYMDFEDRNIRAFLAYCESEPSFVRVLVEAEVAAPAAWEQYLQIREAAYLDIILGGFARGEFPDYRVDQAPQLSMMLTGLRRAMVVRYLKQRIRKSSVPEEAIETYVSFVAHALHPTNLAEIRRIWQPQPPAPESPPPGRKRRPRPEPPAEAAPARTGSRSRRAPPAQPGPGSGG